MCNHTHTKTSKHLRVSLTAFLDYSSHPQTGSTARSTADVIHALFFFQFGVDVWASWRVWPPLPQLTPWSESHIISTHFPNHDMANMSRPGNPSELHCQPYMPQSLLCANKSKGLTATQCPSLPLSIKRSVSEMQWKCSNHTWNPNICTKDTVPLEENSSGNNRATLWGRLFHTLPSVCFFLSQENGFMFFLDSPQGDRFIWSHLLSSIPVMWQRANVKACVNCRGSCVSRMIHARNIHTATAEQQAYSVGWALVL